MRKSLSGMVVVLALLCSWAHPTAGNSFTKEEFDKAVETIRLELVEIEAIRSRMELPLQRDLDQISNHRQQIHDVITDIYSKARPLLRFEKHSTRVPGIHVFDTEGNRLEVVTTEPSRSTAGDLHVEINLLEHGPGFAIKDPRAIAHLRDHGGDPFDFDAYLESGFCPDDRNH